MVTRRQFVVGISGACCFSVRSGPLWAQSTPALLLASALKEVAGAVKAAAEAIEKAYKVGTFIFDDQKDREAKSALESLEQANLQLVIGQAPLIWQISNYRLGESWGQLKFSVRSVIRILTDTTAALSELAPKLPPALSREIAGLAVTYAARGDVIRRFIDLPEPKNERDIAELKSIGEEWSKLHSQLIALNTVLARS